MNFFPKIVLGKKEEEEKKSLNDTKLQEKFLEITSDYEAGLPDNENVKWLGLHPGQICKKLYNVGIKISRYIAKQFLSLQGYKKRRYLKDLCLSNTENRNAQFEKIGNLKKAFIKENLPVFSIDTKKKEPLGNFDRSEQYFGKDKRKVNDHDFNSLASGVVIPHGIYDIVDNHGYITLGTSKDTSEFVCDNILWYWQNHIQWKYPDADSMLLLCDGGGSNSCNHYIVKQDLVKLAHALGINILVAHYPAYCSKWNPIEHRLFCHLHRAYEGSIFHNIQIVKELSLETSTKTGLKVDVRINNKIYETGRKYANDFKENIQKYIIFDNEIPKWNYLINVN